MLLVPHAFTFTFSPISGSNHMGFVSKKGKKKKKKLTGAADHFELGCDEEEIKIQFHESHGEIMKRR